MLHLKDGESVQDHIKAMTELFNELAIVGDAIEEEDRVVYLLASLPDSFNTLVTALEASEDPRQWETKSPKAKKVRLVTRHVLGVREPAHDWIVDSGATCHICNSKGFEDFHPLSEPQKVALGEGHTLEVVGTGVVEVKLKLPGGESKIGRLNKVLYVPSLAYNLLSVAKATEAGKTVTFGETK